ncbi:c-type cytochrome [Yunchengibacter salinarum]|uniref:c-type cytochrome n=1 Tax=Yunchengibacter salinarum TaxID=3133399 RepID=UPI0035B66BCF
MTTVRRAVGIGLLAGLMGLPATALPPAINYKLECMGCHRPDGSGMGDKVPSLRGDMARFLGVEGGRAFLVRVPGTAQSPLNDADTADLLNWMLRRFSAETLPDDFTPFTATEVGRYRAAPLTEVKKTRQALMDKIERLENRGH